MYNKDVIELLQSEVNKYRVHIWLLGEIDGLPEIIYTEGVPFILYVDSIREEYQKLIISQNLNNFGTRFQCCIPIEFDLELIPERR